MSSNIPGSLRPRRSSRRETTAPPPRGGVATRVGIIELLLDTAALSPTDRVFGRSFKRHLTSIMPQAVAVWCRELGHRVFYATYYG